MLFSELVITRKMRTTLLVAVITCWVTAGDKQYHRTPASSTGAHVHTTENALLIAGAVSRLPVRGGNGQFTTANSLYDSSRAYSSIRVCANSILRHIVSFNGIPTDVFLHTWSYDLESQFRGLFNLTAAEFEHNQPYEAQMKGLFPAYSWAEISYTLSVQRVVRRSRIFPPQHYYRVMLMLQHEARTGALYDRVILVRPDVFMNKNLDLSALPRNPKVMYSNSHGNGDGDFHFVMEHAHAESLGSVLWPNVGEKSKETLVVGNHGNMKRFMEHLNSTVKSDGQVYPGFHQDVYRKVPWHMMLCNAADWWRAHMRETYGMGASEWREYELLAESGVRGCSPQDPAQMLNHCCRGGVCTELHLSGSRIDPTCGKRLS